MRISDWSSDVCSSDLDLPTIQRAHDWLVAQFSLPSLLVEKPTFVLRIYHYFKSKAPPEAPLINSFFIDDLTKTSNLVQQNNAPKGLRSYLDRKGVFWGKSV